MDFNPTRVPMLFCIDTRIMIFFTTYPAKLPACPADVDGTMVATVAPAGGSPVPCMYVCVHVCEHM